MNVGIFGGAFDPPHLAHLVAAESAREQFGLQRVLWIPSRKPPHKEEGSTSPQQRLEMTRLAVDDHPDFIASELELHRAGPSYTIDTVRALQEKHPDTRFTFILGGDSLRTFHTWRAPDEIARRVSLVAYERASDQEAAKEDTRFVRQADFVDAPLINVSSTGVRARCREGRSIRYLVPLPVNAYIQQQGLYSATPATTPHAQS